MSSFLESLFNIFRGRNLPDQLAEVGIETTRDAATLHLKTRTGQQIALNDNNIVIQDTNGSMITLDVTGIHIQSAASISLDCSTIAISASQMSLNSPMVKCAGVVQCDTIIATNVVGTNYTPGAGNIS